MSTPIVAETGYHQPIVEDYFSDDERGVSDVQTRTSRPSSPHFQRDEINDGTANHSAKSVVSNDSGFHTGPEQSSSVADEGLSTLNAVPSLTPAQRVRRPIETLPKRRIGIADKYSIPNYSRRDPDAIDSRRRQSRRQSMQQPRPSSPTNIRPPALYHTRGEPVTQPAIPHRRSVSTRPEQSKRYHVDPPGRPSPTNRRPPSSYHTQRGPVIQPAISRRISGTRPPQSKHYHGDHPDSYDGSESESESETESEYEESELGRRPPSGSRTKSTRKQRPSLRHATTTPSEPVNRRPRTAVVPGDRVYGNRKRSNSPQTRSSVSDPLPHSVKSYSAFDTPARVVIKDARSIRQRGSQQATDRMVVGRNYEQELYDDSDENEGVARSLLQRRNTNLRQFRQPVEAEREVISAEAYSDCETYAEQNYEMAGRRSTQDIQLRTDKNALATPSLSGDMEDRTLQLVPIETGMNELIITGSREMESTYVSERTSGRSAQRTSTYPSAAGRDAEDTSERASNSSLWRKHSNEKPSVSQSSPARAVVVDPPFPKTAPLPSGLAPASNESDNTQSRLELDESRVMSPREEESTDAFKNFHETILKLVDGFLPSLDSAAQNWFQPSRPGVKTEREKFLDYLEEIIATRSRDSTLSHTQSDDGKSYIIKDQTALQPQSTAMHAQFESMNLYTDDFDNDSVSVISSYAASVFSIASLASAATDLSRASGYSATQIATATKELVNIFQDDPFLTALYHTALGSPSIGPERLERNLRRLFKVYAEHLKEEASDQLEFLASRLVSLKARHLAQSIVTTLKPNARYPTLHRNEPHDESSDEDDGIEERPVDEDVFEDLISFRDFLIKSEAFGELRNQIQDFVSPKHPELIVNLPSSKATPPSSRIPQQNHRHRVSKLEKTWHGWLNNARQIVDAFFLDPKDFLLAKRALFLFSDAFCLTTDTLFIQLGCLEPPLATSKTRLRWKSKCGDATLSDVTEYRANGILEVVTHLERSTGSKVTSAQHSHQTGNQQYIAPHPVRWLRNGFAKLAASGQTSSRAGPCIPLHTTPGPIAGVSAHNNPPAPQSVLHLMTCMHLNRSRKVLQQDLLKDISTDRGLLKFMRQQYERHRGRWRTMLSFKCVQGIFLVKFNLPVGSTVIVRDHNSYCGVNAAAPVGCECIPPAVMVEPALNAQYRCIPGPPATYPPIPSEHLLMLFSCPSYADETDDWILKQLPKRICGRLRGQAGQPAEGWECTIRKAGTVISFL